MFRGRDLTQYNSVNPTNIAKYPYENYRPKAAHKKNLKNYVMIKGNTNVQYLVISYNLLEC